MQVNMSTGVVSFNNKNEELDTINSLFNAFSVTRDKDLTQKWLFAHMGNYQDFMNFLAEIVVVNMIILQGNKEVFDLGIIQNNAFNEKMRVLSPEIAKLMLVLTQSFKNDFKPKKYPNLNKKEIEGMFDNMIDLFKKKIGYDFMFNKKVKVKFSVEK